MGQHGRPPLTRRRLSNWIPEELHHAARQLPTSAMGILSTSWVAVSNVVPHWPLGSTGLNKTQSPSRI